MRGELGNLAPAEGDAGYLTLKNALVTAQGDIIGFREVLAVQPDFGRAWVLRAYEDLRRDLAQGRLGDAARLSGVIGTVLQLQDRAASSAGPAPAHEMHHEVFQWLVDGIAAILDQDYETGLETLQNVTEISSCAPSLRWLASHWLGRAAFSLGDFPRAYEAAERALELSADLGPGARSASLRERGEVAFQLGQVEEALAALALAIDVCHGEVDKQEIAITLLARARMQAVAGDVTGAIESATQARREDPSWPQPVVFLARQALIEGRVDLASWVLQVYPQTGPTSLEIERELKLVELAQTGAVPPEVICEYTRLRDHPPDDQTVRALKRLIARAPGFIELRELLAWTLFKHGDDDEAATHFEELALEDVDAETRNSILLGLGCLANRRNKHRQLGARLHAARSAARRASVETAAEPAEVVPLAQREGDGIGALVVVDDIGEDCVNEFEEVSSHDSGHGLRRRLQLADASNRAKAPSSAPKVGLTGDLEQFSVPDLMEFLRSSRRTGTLVITAEDGIGVLQLRGGMLVGAASPNSPSIGQALVDIGAISPEQLSAAALEQQRARQGRLLGALLVERGLVTEANIAEALAAQMTEAVCELVCWTRGRFAFDREDESAAAASEIEIELDTQSVLLDALRRLDESRREAL